MQYLEEKRLNELFPHLTFQLKTDFSFERKRYIFDNGVCIFLVRSCGFNEHNILKVMIEREYTSEGILNYGKRINYIDHEIFVVPEHLYEYNVYEMVSQKEKIQNHMEKRAVEKIIRPILDEHFSWL